MVARWPGPRLTSIVTETRMTGPPDKSPALQKPKYRWPWFVLAAILLGFALAILWLSREVERTRRLRDLNALPPAQRVK
jgi:hypothetical protein